MNREDALAWLQYLTILGDIWPKSCNWPSPDGWKWIVTVNPYQRSEFKLMSLKTDESITRGDVK